MQPLLDLLKDGKPEPYPAGSFGPDAADALLERDGHARHSLTVEKE
jgi:glucose-6-phosphate 1-dehydrogenase